ncbi:hypothetical protein pdam_00006461 [Pocillopora damicornis]|uniref:Uncharacterized protein n=1 Tax=Pocillopora damicornis TaxID=46731 RepID=A0A3M6UYK8_POCDA|nr:hypothetical protein pdam_00006461 [Pocillopora damicornis]
MTHKQILVIRQVTFNRQNMYVQDVKYAMLRGSSSRQLEDVQSPFQRALDHLSKVLSWVGL